MVCLFIYLFIVIVSCYVPVCLVQRRLIKTIPWRIQAVNIPTMILSTKIRKSIFFIFTNSNFYIRIVCGCVRRSTTPQSTPEDKRASKEEEKPTPSKKTPSPVANCWAYAELDLRFMLSFQFNPISGAAALLGIDNINATNNIHEQTNKRISDISGYTAGSSNSASTCSATNIKPPKGVRFSEATMISSSSGATESRMLQPQPLLSKRRLAYLREKYVNNELLYNILDFIDRGVAQIPQQERHVLSRPVQVKRDSKRLLPRDQKRVKLNEIRQLIPFERIVFAKCSTYSMKYYPGKAWALLSTGEYMIEFYNGLLKHVDKEFIFDEFEETSTEKKVMLLRYAHKTAIPALVSEIFTENDEVFCKLITDEGDLDRVHVSCLYLTEAMVDEMRTTRKRKLILPIKKAKRDYANAKSSAEFDSSLRKRPKRYISPSSSEDTETQVESAPLIAGCEPERIFYVPFIDDKLKGKQLVASVKEQTFLGPLTEGNWFKGHAFILTCSQNCQSVPRHEATSEDENFVFTDIPYVYSHLESQIKLAGGIVFENYTDIPNDLTRNLFLIAPRPCLTARYIECMTYNVKLICHEWVVRCARAKGIVPFQELPLGWSIEEKRFINSFERLNSFPFLNLVVKITSQRRNNHFFEFWSRLMQYCGAEVRPKRRNKSDMDAIIIESGYDCDQLPVAVTPIWVIQSILHGEMQHIFSRPEYELTLD